MTFPLLIFISELQDVTEWILYLWTARCNKNLFSVPFINKNRDILKYYKLDSTEGSWDKFISNDNWEFSQQTPWKVLFHIVLLPSPRNENLVFKIFISQESNEQT